MRGRYAEEELLHINRGKPLKFGQHQYHTPLYRDLLMNVVPLRKEYRRVKDLDARKEMAKQEFDFWHGYLNARKEEIADLESRRKALEDDVEGKEAHKDSLLHYSHSLKEADQMMLKDFFDRYKDRKTHKLPADKLTEFLGEYSKMYIVKIPLHPKNMS